MTRGDEIERLRTIRKNAKVLVAFGSCACFGGVNQLKNRFEDPAWVKKQVYGTMPIDTNDTAQPLDDFVTVDLRIYGCPVKKEEVEKIVTNLVLGKSVVHPKYPVCMECKANENICLFDLGEPCLGPDHPGRLRFLVPEQPVRLLGLPRSRRGRQCRAVEDDHEGARILRGDNARPAGMFRGVRAACGMLRKTMARDQMTLTG